MDFKEAKKIIAYARKNGIRSLKIGDFSVELESEPVAFERAAPAPAGAQDPNTRPAPPAEPTLAEINEYIYGKAADETH